MIQLFSPYVCEEAAIAVKETLESGWIGLGPKTEQFEKAFAEYCGAKYAVATNSATAALDLALSTLNLESGDEVITTSMTFIATNHAILLVGAVPVFVDVDPKTLNMDLDRVEAYIGPRTKAIMAVHYAGNPLDLDRLYALGQKYGISIVEDAAHACGASYRSKKIGSFGLTCFSFNAVKNLPIGDGGMVTTSDKEEYEKMQRLRWHGISASTYDRFTSKGYKWEYEVQELGHKYQMNDITAAMGIEQLKYLDEWNWERFWWTQKYQEKLEGFVELLGEQAESESSNHLFVIKVPDRARLVNVFKERQIEMGVHYRPNHYYPLYAQYSAKSLFETERAYKHIVSLPLHLDLSEEGIEKVVEAVKASV